MNNQIPTRCIEEQGEHLPEGDFDVVELINYFIIKELQRPWKAKPRPYYPSSFGDGRCKRSLYLHRTGADAEKKHPIKDMLLFACGDAYHEVLQRIMKDHQGIQIEESVKIPDLDISGRCDGVFATEEWVLEIKSVGDSTFRSLIRPKSDHIYQAHCYMWGLDIPRAQILYVNRNDGSLRKFDVFFENEVWEKIVTEINEMDDRVANQDIPDFTENTYQCYGCKFKNVSCHPPEKKK